MIKEGLQIDLGHIFILLIVVVAALRWYRTRRRLYQMTEMVNDMLRERQITSIDLFKSPKLRRKLTLLQLTDRLNERLDRLAKHGRK